MSWLFGSGHAVDVVLVVIAAEFIWLVARGSKVTASALLLLPAVFILLALRGALTGSSWFWIALPLAVSLPFHLLDVRHRRLAGTI